MADLLEAQVALTRKDNKAAIAHLEAALQKDPTNKVALFWKAQLGERQGGNRESEAIYEQLVRERPVKELEDGLSLAAAANWALATLSLENQDVDAAIVRLEDLLKGGMTTEMSRPVRWQLAAARSTKGQWPAAKAEIESLLKKDPAQNDLEADFVMFWTSPEGMAVYLENKLDPENLQGGIEGPPLIKNVELPGQWAEVFENSVFVGNYEKPGAPGDAVARGFFKYEPTKREWSIMVQEFFEGQRTAEEFATDYQTLLEENWDGLLEYLNVEDADSDVPEKRPPRWVAVGPY